MANALFSTCWSRRRERRCREGGAKHRLTLCFPEGHQWSPVFLQLEALSSPALRVHWASVLLCFESLPFTEGI